MASAMARMAAAALRAHTTLPVPRAAGCGRAPSRVLLGCGRTPAGAPMLRHRFSLSFSRMIETLAPMPPDWWEVGSEAFAVEVLHHRVNTRILALSFF